MSVPVDPEAPEAREWLLRELSERAYIEAQPNWFDRLANALWEWLTSLNVDPGEGDDRVGVVLLIVLAVAVLVAALLIFGRPVRQHRSRATGDLFGADDQRSAEQIRRDAEASARAERWAEAVADMFRAIARGLSERTIVTTLPGTTAQDFAAKAATAFPAHRHELDVCADDFDAVRYLEHEASREQYERVASLEAQLRSTRPVLESDPAEAPA